MGRGLFVPFVAFVLPFAVYWIYRQIQRRRLIAHRTAWPVTVLFLTGVVLAIQTFALTALTEPHVVSRTPEAPVIIKDER